MSNKDPSATDPHTEDSNEPPLPPPPSYSESSNAAKFAAQAPPDPAGQGTSSSVYQAQPVAGSSGLGAGGDTSPFVGQAYPPTTGGQPYAPGSQPYAPGSQPYAPPSTYPPGPPGSHPYVPPGGQPYGPPGSTQYPPQPPPGTNAVIYVVDDPMASNAAPARSGMPMAMLFFILG
ncbi:hypothetical protein DFQ27_006422 [Actinomortierella ambigua]|uniref:Uncharacterized protein n=1 Tax=Actinomortierella ambigua TaxID=1343610 RepID=A0A9P6PYH2_9FUNG|nr:hypothetical protein DFQ27_006422 [Actinomortierella ambigua]